MIGLRDNDAAASDNPGPWLLPSPIDPILDSSREIRTRRAIFVMGVFSSGYRDVTAPNRSRPAASSFREGDRKFKDGVFVCGCGPLLDRKLQAIRVHSTKPPNRRGRSHEHRLGSLNRPDWRQSGSMTAAEGCGGKNGAGDRDRQRQSRLDRASFAHGSIPLGI